MTQLTFPTQAERALADWQASRRGSLVAFSRRRGATVEREPPATIILTFDDDDTSIRASGRGPNHKVETFLP